jgi:hypothetical protein
MTKPTRARNAGGTGGLFRRVVLGAAALVGLVLVAAACSGGGGGPGVAHVGAGGTNSPSPSPSPGGDSALAFSRCMRAHGITDFPDPDSKNGDDEIRIQPGSDLDPHNPVFRSAQRACQSLMPAPSREDQQRALAQALNFSRCMRAHGISNFPDPQAEGGGITINMRKGSTLDPNNPQFQAAKRACQHYLSGNGEGETSSPPSG